MVATESVLNNYRVLCDVLGNINREGRDEYAAKADGFLNQMERLYTYFGLRLSHVIFSATEQLSCTLQGSDTTIQTTVQASKLALKYVERQRMDQAFEAFYEQVLQSSKDLTDKPALP